MQCKLLEPTSNVQKELEFSYLSYQQHSSFGFGSLFLFVSRYFNLAAAFCNFPVGDPDFAGIVLEKKTSHIVEPIRALIKANRHAAPSRVRDERLKSATAISKLSVASSRLIPCNVLRYCGCVVLGT